MSLEDILEDRWDTRIDRNMGTPKETPMDLSKLPTDALEAELRRRRDQARIDAIAKRGRIGSAIAEACRLVPDFRELLIPNIKGELHDAVFKNPEDYEIALTSYYNPLQEERE